MSVEVKYCIHVRQNTTVPLSEIDIPGADIRVYLCSACHHALISRIAPPPMPVAGAIEPHSVEPQVRGPDMANDTPQHVNIAPPPPPVNPDPTSMSVDDVNEMNRRREEHFANQAGTQASTQTGVGDNFEERASSSTERLPSDRDQDEITPDRTEQGQTFEQAEQTRQDEIDHVGDPDAPAPGQDEFSDYHKTSYQDHIKGGPDVKQTNENLTFPGEPPVEKDGNADKREKEARKHPLAEGQLQGEAINQKDSQHPTPANARQDAEGHSTGKAGDPAPSRTPATAQNKDATQNPDRTKTPMGAQADKPTTSPADAQRKK